MVAEHRLAEYVEHRVLRVVLVHGDLLEHDLALGIDVDERRPPHHVGDHVERARQVFVQHPRVDGRGLLVGPGVELRAQPSNSRSISDGRVAVRALEQQVLEEVRQARPLDRLAARAGMDVEAQRRRAHAVHALGDDAQAGRQLGEAMLGHKKGGAPQ